MEKCFPPSCHAQMLWEAFHEASLVLQQPHQLPMHACVHAKWLQSCLTLCKPMDCSLPGSSVHGILQARILEWVVMPSSRGSSRPRDQSYVCKQLPVAMAKSVTHAHTGSPSFPAPHSSSLASLSKPNACTWTLASSSAFRHRLRPQGQGRGLLSGAICMSPLWTDEALGGENWWEEWGPAAVSSPWRQATDHSLSGAQEHQ